MPCPRSSLWFDASRQTLAQAAPTCFEIVDRILDGENRVKVWREHRGLTSKALAEKAGIAQSFLPQIETWKRDGTVETLQKIAAALDLSLDDLVDQGAIGGKRRTVKTER